MIFAAGKAPPTCQATVETGTAECLRRRGEAFQPGPKPKPWRASGILHLHFEHLVLGRGTEDGLRDLAQRKHLADQRPHINAI